MHLNKKKIVKIISFWSHQWLLFLSLTTILFSCLELVAKQTLVNFLKSWLFPRSKLIGKIIRSCRGINVEDILHRKFWSWKWVTIWETNCCQQKKKWNWQIRVNSNPGSFCLLRTNALIKSMNPFFPALRFVSRYLDALLAGFRIHRLYPLQRDPP